MDDHGWVFMIRKGIDFPNDPFRQLSIPTETRLFIGMHVWSFLCLIGIKTWSCHGHILPNMTCWIQTKKSDCATDSLSFRSLCSSSHSSEQMRRPLAEVQQCQSNHQLRGAMDFRCARGRAPLLADDISSLGSASTAKDTATWPTSVPSEPFKDTICTALAQRNQSCTCTGQQTGSTCRSRSAVASPTMSVGSCTLTIPSEMSFWTRRRKLKPDSLLQLLQLGNVQVFVFVDDHIIILPVCQRSQYCM